MLECVCEVVWGRERHGVSDAVTDLLTHWSWPTLLSTEVSRSQGRGGDKLWDKSGFYSAHLPHKLGAQGALL